MPFLPLQNTSGARLCLGEIGSSSASSRSGAASAGPLELSGAASAGPLERSGAASAGPLEREGNS